MNKDKLTNGQKYMYDKIHTELEKQLNEYTAKVRAVLSLAFFPKKDGTEKQNFALNFGTSKGETYEIKWSETNKEKRRFVNISKQTNYQGIWTGVDFSIAPLWDDKHEKQLVPYTSHSIYFNWNIFNRYEKPKNAKDAFFLIQGPYLKLLISLENEYKEALQDFNINFEKLCCAATSLQEHIKSIKAPIFSSYAYNLQGRDNHYLASNYFED